MQKICKNIVSILASITAMIVTHPVKADSIDQPYLQNIQTYTQNIQNTSNSILNSINTIFTYMTQLNLLALTWMNADNSSSQNPDWSSNWTNEKTWLESLSTSAMTNENKQYSMQTALLTNFFGAKNIQATPPIPPNINDLAYVSMLGQLLVSPDPRGDNVNVAMNYLTNASGLGASLTLPSPGFRGKENARDNYTKFYNAMTAVQTYNGFVLSRLYQDSQTKQNDSDLRTKLITQSSNADWFSSVITNDLGWVLRQILLYTSQSYILMDQSVQTQKQMAATLAMTNTLLIVNNMIQGDQLLKQAQGS